MDFNGLRQAIENSRGIPTAALMHEIDRGRVSGTLKKPPLSNFLQMINSRPPPVFPEVETDPFTYSPLPTATSIRLLKIGPEDEDGLLRCFLETVDLHARPLFHCLSYTWVGSPLHPTVQCLTDLAQGSPLPEGSIFQLSDESRVEYGASTTWPISLNNKLFHVRQNLFECLKEMPRHPWVHIRHDKGKTALHQAAEKNDSMMAWLVIAQGGRPNCKDNDGRTPLHYAAQSGSLELVEVLISAGAEVDALDHNQKSPAIYAREHGNDEVLGYFTRLEKLQEKPKISFGAKSDAPPTYVWVDAICIDQSNDNERGHQVGLMRKIYEAAQCVSVWLGKSDILTEHAIQAIGLIAAHREQFTASKIMPYQENADHTYESAGVPKITGLQWNALAALYLRKWFTRAWIIQETVLAREVLVWCGQHGFIFDDLCFATEALCSRYEAMGYPSSANYGHRLVSSPADGQHVQHEDRFECLRDVAGPIEGHFNVVMKIKIGWIINNLPPERKPPPPRWNRLESLTLVALLFQTWIFESTEARDKIYSVLGLAVGDADDYEITPDYNKPADELYTQITQYISRRFNSLEFLVNIPDSGRRNRLPNLPSWVLDFSTTGISGMYGAHFNAAGERQKDPLLPLPADPRRLAVSGLRIGGVAEIGNSWEGNNAHIRFDPTWLEMVSHLDPVYFTGEDRAEVLWRTLCLNQDVLENVDAPAAFRNQFRELTCAMICDEAEKSQAKKAHSMDLSYVLMKQLILAQGTSTEEAEKMTQFARAVYETKEQADQSVHGPTFDSIRGSLNLLDDLTKGRSNSALPTLDEVEDFRKNSGWRLSDAHGHGNIKLPEDSRFATTMGSRYHRRRLFRTKESQLGLGPRSLQVGDEVWILGGARYPFLLRPLENGAYWLVGTIYVHGIMHGEAIKPEVEFREIELA